MKNRNCIICQRKHLLTDTFLFENKYGLFVLNPSNILKTKEKIFAVRKRFTVAIKDHIKKPSSYLIRMIRSTFKEFLKSRYSLVWKRDYDFFVTLNTYPDHWHMHACVYPYKEITTVTIKRK